MYVLKWPDLSGFLQVVSGFCDLYIFTASEQDYANPIIDKIESSSNVNIKKWYFWSDCEVNSENSIDKKINVIKEINFERTVIIDDSAWVKQMYPKKTL